MFTDASDLVGDGHQRLLRQHLRVQDMTIRSQAFTAQTHGTQGPSDKGPDGSVGRPELCQVLGVLWQQQTRNRR